MTDQDELLIGGDSSGDPIRITKKVPDPALGAFAASLRRDDSWWDVVCPYPNRWQRFWWRVLLGVKWKESPDV